MPNYATGITQSASDHIVLILYVQHSQLLTDPLDSSGTFKDTAQFNYLNYYKSLGKTKAQWQAGNVKYQPPLTAMSELYFNGKHTLKVHHLGLNPATDQITPYITDKPPGYFVGINPITNTGSLPINTNGFPLATSGCAQFTAQGRNRLETIMKEIFASQYFQQQIDSGLIYDKNVAGKIDLVIIATPPLYKRGYYGFDKSGGVGMDMSIHPAIKIGTRYINGANWQPLESSWVLLHQYLHFSYKGAIRKNITVDNRRVPSFIPDLYVSAGGGAPSWLGSTPLKNSCIMAQSKNLLVSPMVAASLGLTDLKRTATTSGIYKIKNRAQSDDYLVIRSPKDKDTMCILAVHHPQTFKGTENYWNSDPAGKGIYATFVRWIMNANGMFSNPDCSQYPFGRLRGTPYSAYTNYNLTERYGYAPIDMAATITNVINGTSEPNRKPLLTDFVTPAGINISWIGWQQDQNGIKSAVVNIQIEQTDQSVVPLTISKSPLPGGLAKIDIDGVATNFSRNCSVPKYKISTNPDMSNAKEFNTILNINGELYTLPYKQKVQIAIPYGIAPRYVQLVTYNGTNVEHSNVLSFTPRAFNPNAVPWSFAMCNYTSSNMAKIYFGSLGVALCGWQWQLKSGSTIVQTGSIPMQLNYTRNPDLASFSWQPRLYQYITFNNLKGDTVYSASIRANFMDNYSSWRPLIGFKTKQGVVQLDKPVIDSIKAISLQSIEIKHNYNPKVTGYKLTYTAGSHSYMDNSSDVDGVMYGRVFHAGLEVQVKMLGTGSNGYTTDWSDPYKFVMPKIQQPIIIKLENRNNAYLDVEWMGQSNLLQNPYYTVNAYIQVDDETPQFVFPKIAKKTCSIPITKQMLGKGVIVQVRSQYGSLKSEQSEPAKIFIAAAIPTIGEAQQIEAQQIKE